MTGFYDNTALVVIATGERYRKYLHPLLDSARQYFVPHKPVIFSDQWDLGRGLHPFMLIKDEGFPGATLHRYRTMMQAERYLRAFDFAYYLDVDMRMVAPVGPEVYCDGILGVLHPGYVGTCGTPERRPESLAYIAPNEDNKYFCGGFNGGDADKFMDMAKVLAEFIDTDEQNGVVAIWNDESHLNRYLHTTPPAKILGPDYCYPEDAGSHYKDKWAAAGITVTPKILALTKDKG